MTSMREQLEAIEPGSFDGLERYMEAGARHYRVVAEKMVNRDFRWPIDYLRIGALGLLARGNPLANHYRGMSAYFDAPRLKSAFTFRDLYVGLSPFEAPAILSLPRIRSLRMASGIRRAGCTASWRPWSISPETPGVEFTSPRMSSGSTPTRTQPWAWSWRTGRG